MNSTINLTTFTSADSIIKTPEISSQEQKIAIAKQSEPTLTIDEKVNDKVSLDNTKELNANVIAKKDSEYTIRLSNDKTITVNLPDADLKVNDKLVISLENSKITNIQIKDIAQTVNLNVKDFEAIVNAIIKQNTTSLIQENKLPVIISPIPEVNIANNQTTDIKTIVEAKILNALMLSLSLTTNAGSKALQEAILDIGNLTLITKDSQAPIQQVEFKTDAIKTLVQALQTILKADNPKQSLDLKVIKQETNNIIQTSLNKDIKLELNLAKPENILTKFITLKPTTNDNQFNLVKHDTSNTITSIKVNAETFKNIIEPLKQNILAKVTEPASNNIIKPETINQTGLKQEPIANSQPTNTLTTTNQANTVTLPVQVNDNKVVIPSLNNLTIKVPVKIEQPIVNNQPSNLNSTSVSIKPEVSINNSTVKPVEQNIKQPTLTIQNIDNKPQISLTVNDKTYNFENLDIQLTDKQINSTINSLIQQSSVINKNANAVLLKSPNAFEILLNVKNNANDVKAINFNLTDSGKIQLEYTNVKASTPVEKQINQASIPHIAKNFAPQLSLMLASAIIATKQAEQQSDKNDIFSLMLDSMPEASRPKLQVSSQNNESWKYFTFPYYQEEDDQQYKNGQILYSNAKDENGNSIINFAVKANFTKLGDIMLKFKILNKNINLNIYTQSKLTPLEIEKLSQASQEAILNSGFSGTVSIKNTKHIEIPLLNSEKIVYSGINIKI